LAFGAASVQNRFVTGLASGAWELDETPAPGAWLLQDPVLLQAAGTGVIPVTALGYGRSLNACVTEQSDASIVFSSSEVGVRYTHLDVAVDTP
jgi:hypothetical protein